MKGKSDLLSLGFLALPHIAISFLFGEQSCFQVVRERRGIDPRYRLVGVGVEPISNNRFDLGIASVFVPNCLRPLRGRLRIGTGNLVSERTHGRIARRTNW